MPQDHRGTGSPAGAVGRRTAVADRYGSRSRLPHNGTHAATASGRGKRPWIIAALAAALVIMIGLAAWFAFAPARVPDTPKTVSYDVVDASLTVTRFSIVPDESRDIECAVQATNLQEAVVGFREVTIPARAGTSTSEPVQLDVDIRTTQLAASGHVESCWYVS
ncbi:DUF4307 domain-containing protein [Brevibacterium luteolum]|uniref:DUF4307 domain-containing protein n=1 Tax=Brevibacterium luteolum TaxID=199591 RepID=A0A2N6PF48_9MICO|nr:DUF4307 domain-containing protein [Brevibacterium luteolum]MBM7529059.1 hypothetical protein [Brevibacterium luteolum]MCT1658104.1 DUF4307 domain-containing protein [Brevibacterium luteolum]MCT1830455.1 DUF4307 domain-containing protein [Brevibacterium luteolum]NNG79983.1 DUF4307 domain-containing protein [Brevibacterium luteolum]PMB97307.1 DUF4307 domain-containing protein [Brevibacterium luteolum]